MTAYLVMGLNPVTNISRRLGAFGDLKEALAWAESGQVPPEFPLFAIASVDNAFYRLIGVRIGGTAWERLPGNFGDNRERA